MRNYLIVLICLLTSTFLRAADPDIQQIQTFKTSLTTIKESTASEEEKNQKTDNLVQTTIAKLENISKTYGQGMSFDKVKRTNEFINKLKAKDYDALDTDNLANEEKAKKAESVEKVVAPTPFLKEYFSEGLTDKDGKNINLSDLNGKVVGLYFSAHWCGPCRQFTPQLVKIRDENSKLFEVVFVSSDRSEDDRKKYMEEAKMQWPTVKWSGKDGTNIKQKFKVRGIPHLVILSKSGTVLTENGRSEVSAEAIKKWIQEK